MIKPVYVVTALLPMNVYATSISFDKDLQLYSEPLSIVSFLDDWDNPDFKPGTHAFAHSKIYLNFQEGNWNTGWVWRYDYALEFSKDASLLYYQIANDHKIDKNKTYDVLIKARHVDSVGARIGYDWHLPNLKITTGATALIGREYLDGQVSASGLSKDYLNVLRQGANLNIDYSYSQPVLKEDDLGLGDYRPDHGYGYSFDITVDYQPIDALRLKVRAEDIYGYLHWSKAPYTYLNLDYNPKNRKKILDFDYAVSTQEEYKQKLPYKIYSDIEFKPTKNTNLGVHAFTNPYLTLWQLSAQYHFLDLDWGVHLEPETDAYGFSVKHKNFGLKYITDDWNTNEARRIDVQLFASYFW